MSAPVLEKINAINSTLASLLEETRRSLAGQAEFDVDLVRQLSQVLSEMDLLLPHAKQLRSAHPALCAPLDHYIRLATALRSELEKVNVMLLARRAALESARTYLHAASQFVDALSTTR
jgi:hypothetical protein